MPSIEAIEDIGSRHRVRLKAASLGSCQNLLEAGATRRGRRIISETVGVAAVSYTHLTLPTKA